MSNQSEIGRKVIDALSTALSRKLELLLTAATAAVMAAAAGWRDYLARFVPDPAAQWAVLTTAAAIAGLLIAAATYFAVRPRLKHLTMIGVYEDLKTGDYYCANCFLKSKLHAPLYLTPDERHYKCSVCQHTRIVEIYEPVDPPKPSEKDSSWMAN